MSRQTQKSKISKAGLVRDLNPGPRAPEAQIIPLDQRATQAGGRRLHHIVLYIFLIRKNSINSTIPDTWELSLRKFATKLQDE